MTLRYMIDTDVTSHLMRSRDQRLAQKVTRHADQVCISSVTLGELYYGAGLTERCSHHLAQIDDLKAVMPVLDFDAEAAANYGDIRAHLKRAGTPIGALDPMIAAHARSRGLVLVTAKLRHFGVVEGLRLETWL